MVFENETLNNADRGYIKGEMLYTIFENESEHFSIAKIKIHETNEDYKEKEIVAKGYFSNLQTGTIYEFFGQLVTHPKFGLQYQVNAYQTVMPDTVDSVIDYLSSDLFYGVGKKTAEKIVDHLGEDAITKIIEKPERLSEIQGLNNKTAQTLVKTLQDHRGFEHVVVYLNKYQIGLKMAQKIYDTYKEETIDYLQADPYRFVYEIEGFGFQTADKIAQLNGLSVTHPNRIGAGCIYALQMSVQDGHVYIPIETCINETLRLLKTPDLTEEMVIERLNDLNKEKHIILNDGKVYLPMQYYAEDGFSSHLKRLLTKDVEQETTLAELMKITGEIEEDEHLSYGKEQFTAIKQAIQSKVMILTGGPGTGKTTVIKGIMRAYATINQLSMDPEDYDNKKDYPFILTAPTGRAARRLSESTNRKATTIHRLLGWDGKDYFEKNEHDQLSGQLLIVDEFSMVDIWLANQLFKAIPDHMQVLLVGDEDQLPSVGPGQVLSDLLNSQLIPFVRLNEVYRQEEGSKIIDLAHQIKNDLCTEEDLKKENDFSFIACQESQVIDVITTIFNKATDKGIDVKDIQVLAPMYRSQAGISEINKSLQQLINPKVKGKRERHIQDVVFRVGDRVIQLVNQPEDGVSNGDIGEIVAIFKASENEEKQEQMVIAFDEKEVTYSRQEYTNIMHAYCISIHKSQGSEFPIVILPVVKTYGRMLRKNLLYTAITRSKNSLIMCGEKTAFVKGVQTKDTNLRYTTLQDQLKEKLNGLNKRKKNKQQEEFDDENELSPYDFM